MINDDFLKKMITVSAPTEEQILKGVQKWEGYIKPLLIDQWSEELMSLSVPTTFLEFPIELAKDWFEREINNTKLEQDFAKTIDNHLNGEDKFYRLNSRSPKDYAISLISNSGFQILRNISGSMRMLDDLSNFSRSVLKPYLCFRKVIDAQPNNEFRVFIKEGKLLGVSANRGVNIPIAKELIVANIMSYLEDNYHVLPLDTIVVDLVFNYSDNSIILLEVNPYGLSDPLLFNNYATLESSSNAFRFV